MLLLLRVNRPMWSEETLQSIIDGNKAIAWDAAINRRKRKRNGDSILLVSDAEKSDQSSMSEWKPLRVINGQHITNILQYIYLLLFALVHGILLLLF